MQRTDYGSVTDATMPGFAAEPASSHRDRVPAPRERYSMGSLRNPGPAGLDEEDAGIFSDDDASVPQAGVRRLEAIESTWTFRDLIVAYSGVFLVCFTTSLEAQTTANLQVYATSAFSAHSLISTVVVVQSVALSVAKPVMSKIADVYGRLEAFTLSMFIFAVGYVLQSTSVGIKTFIMAQIFYAIGQTGLQILIQIFMADTSTLANRSLCSALPAAPFLINVWLGAPLADKLLRTFNWRLGYGMWAVILPTAYIPLAYTLRRIQKKAARHGILPPSPFMGKGIRNILKDLWYELDVFGLVLISAGVGLILVPLTTAASTGWTDSKIIVMLVVGGFCMVGFVLWERNKKLAPRPFLPTQLFKERTIKAGCLLAFFFFMSYFCSVQPYFQSYLLVARDQTVTSAGQTVQIFTLTSTITGLGTGYFIRHVKRYKRFVVLGTLIYLGGLSFMLWNCVTGAATWVVVAGQIVIGFGAGMFNIQAQTGVQAAASRQNNAASTAFYATFLEIGGAVGSAVSGAIWTSKLPEKLKLYLPPETRHQAHAIFGNVALAGNGWPMGSPTRDAINRAYRETMTALVIVAVGMAIPVFLLSLFMENYDLSRMDQDVKGLVIGAGQDDESNYSIESSSMESYDESEPMLRPSSSSEPAYGRLRKPS